MVVVIIIIMIEIVMSIENIGDNMKKFILGLIAAFCFSGCAVYADNPGYNNCFEFVDEYGVRTVCNAQRQYIGNEWYYWDVNLGCWIGRAGYFSRGHYFSGIHPN